MRLESAIRAGSESLFATGQAISVVGDNISNVNTTAYKTTRTEFADLFGAGPNTGDNPAVDGQIGDGAKVGRTRQLHEIGVLEGTGRELDFAIDGKGYFMVQAPTTTAGATNPIYYTRAGNFSVTATGILIGPDGKQVLGYGPNDTARTGPLGAINMKQITGGAKATTRATLVGNISSTSEIKGQPGAVTSFPELARGTNATFMVNVIDSQGARREVQAVFSKLENNRWLVTGYVDGKDVEGGTAGVLVSIGSGEVTYDGNGLNTGGGEIPVTVNWSNGAGQAQMTIDVTGFTQYATNTAPIYTGGDGEGLGSIMGYQIASDGTITAELSSGSSRVLGTLALATFMNEDGLQRIGSTLYTATDAAGEPTISVGDNEGFGAIRNKQLERSNVDIAGQFSELIIVQRAYQANSQIISASNDLLRNTLALIR